MTTKPTQRFGVALPFEVATTPRKPFKTDAKTDDAQFFAAVAKGLQDAEDEAEPSASDREELKKQIRSEVLRELHQRLVVKPAPPEPPPRAGFVRDPSVDKFFELAAEEKAARRRRGH